MASVAEELVSRMPMAYVHLVHLLVDSFLVSTPFVLYPRCGALVVPAAGLLTLFFRGPPQPCSLQLHAPRAVALL